MRDPSTMAMASARLLSRRVCLSSFSNSGPSSASSSSPLADEALVLSRYLSSFSLANVGLDSGNEAVRFRVYCTGLGEGSSEEQNENLAQSAPKAPPRPFKLNNEQRELAEEIGYKVVHRGGFRAEQTAESLRSRSDRLSPVQGVSKRSYIQ